MVKGQYVSSKRKHNYDGGLKNTYGQVIYGSPRPKSRESREAREASFREYKKEALTTADDFNYPNHVLVAIRHATTSDQIANIMTRARMAKFK